MWLLLSERVAGIAITQRLLIQCSTCLVNSVRDAISFILVYILSPRATPTIVCCVLSTFSSYVNSTTGCCLAYSAAATNATGSETGAAGSATGAAGSAPRAVGSVTGVTDPATAGRGTVSLLT